MSGGSPSESAQILKELASIAGATEYIHGDVAHVDARMKETLANLGELKDQNERIIELLDLKQA